MATRRAALCALLMEAGLSPARAKHFERSIDRGRFASLSSDDLAGIILELVRMRVHKLSLPTKPPRLSHSLNDVPGQAYMWSAK